MEEALPLNVTDSIGESGELDVFAVELVAGVEYTAVVFGRSTTGDEDALPDPVLAVVDDAGGVVAVSDDLLGLDPVATFTVPESGTYGVGVGGFGGTTGGYTLALGETEELLATFDLPLDLLGEIA
jgi:hypothetical protein